MINPNFTYLKELEHNPTNTICLLVVLHSSGVLIDEYAYHPYFTPDLLINFAGKDVAIQLATFPDLAYLTDDESDSLMQSLMFLILSSYFANKHNQN